MNENNKFDVVGTNIAEKATMIWNVADMLRGPFKPHEYGLIILPMTVVKRFHGPFTKIDGKKYTFNNLIKIYELVARYYNEPDIIKMVYANFRDILSK